MGQLVTRITDPPATYSALSYGVSTYHHTVDSTNVHQNNQHSYSVNFCSINGYEKRLIFDWDI